MSAVSRGTVPSLPSNYKWIVLSNTTIGMLLATINASILLIALPDIFRGIQINPLAPGNTNYLLWMILSFLIVTAVLVVSLGRIGDIVRPGADLQPRLRRALRQFDRTHAAYLEQFYGVDIRDSTLYHLVLDSTCLEFDACVEIIAEAARSHRVVVPDQPRNGPRH